jgi:cellulose synthase/poly-beta-1,6-N-acetylglucosamine synthase-like glycosyltransferase
MPDTVAIIVLALTTGVFAFLVPFAGHRAWLVVQARRRRDEDRAAWPEDRLPVVTVQLPMYDERAVAARAVDAAAALDYPTDRLEIQVLDDSDDVTSWIVERRVAHWKARGVDIEHLRRGERTGFKAGALAFGTERARGDFILVLDADFVPAPDLVRSLLPPMSDPRVGMVQAAWDHLNREESWLTIAQSYLLDGHFLFEQGGRYGSGRFFNFNGTAGLWRRRCLEEAGGWQADTLTEDLDLSYRAQMAGWRFVYLDDVRVPAEIPGTVTALEVQQRRWAQGGIQTGRKILPRLLRGAFPPGVKIEAVVHLLGHLAHPLTWALALLLFPSAVARRALDLEHLLGLDLLLFASATIPFMAFYWLAGEGRGRPRENRLREVLQTLALGIGLSVPVSRAVVRGLGGAEDPFLRTPKRGSSDGGERPGGSYRSSLVPFDEAAKLGMAALMTTYLVAAVAGGYWGQIPFLVLFLSGYLTLGLPGLRAGRGPRWATSTGVDGSRAGTSSRAGISTTARAGALPEHTAGVGGEQQEEGHPEGGPDGRGLRPRPGVLVAGEAEVADECEAA